MRRLLLLALLACGLRAEDWIHIITYGQSLSVGHGGTPSLTTSQPYSNKMWTVCGVARTAANIGSLIEPDACQAATGTGNVESEKSSLANTATMLSPGAAQIYLVSQHGVAATPYCSTPPNIGLAKSTSCTGTYAAYGATPYDDLIDSVTTGKAAADAAGKTYRVGAVMWWHGQSDYGNGATSQTYAGYLTELQANLDTDIKAITGQAADIPLIVSQWSSWPKYTNGGNSYSSPTVGGVPNTGYYTLTTSGAGPVLSTPFALWKAAMDHYADGKIYLTGPEYPYPYLVDGVHETNLGYRKMGGLAGYVVDWVVRQGKGWKPVTLRSASISGSTISTVWWTPPGSCLASDTVNVSDPGNWGLEYWQASGSPPTITATTITGCNTLDITLSGPATGSARLAYAYTGAPNTGSGPTTSPRGNIRSDLTITSQAGDSVYAWAPMFNVALPYSWNPVPVSMSVSPSSLDFTCVVGAGNPAGQTITFTSSGGDTEQFSVTKSEAWLSVTPTSGTAATDLTASVDCTGLSVGAHSDTITVSSTDLAVTNSPRTVSVSLNVFNPGPATVMGGNASVGGNTVIK